MSEKAIVLPVITESQACGSQRLTWAATPRLTYMQQLVLGRSRGRTPFSTWVSVSLWLPSITDTCGPFCSLEHRKHDLVMSPALWPYKAGDILQRISRTQTNQGVRAKGSWANLLREREAGKFLRPEVSACLCLFSEIENVISCSVFLVILGGMLPQGQSVFCAKSRQNNLVRNTSGPGLANKMPIIATRLRPMYTWGSNGTTGQWPSSTSVTLPAKPLGRRVRNGSTQATTRRQLKHHEEWLIQMVQAISKAMGLLPFSFQVQNTRRYQNCWHTGNFDHLLQQKGGRQ